MIQSWTRFFLRQTAFAGTVLVTLFLLAELLAPGSVLPFLNLHALLIGALVLHGLILLWPSDHNESLISRMAVIISLGILLFAMTWFVLWGAGNSAMLLALAVTGLIVSFGLAIIQSYAKH